MDPRVPHGPHGWEDHSFSVLPLIGNFVFLLLILALVAHRALSVAHGKIAAGRISAERGRRRRRSAFSPSASPAGTSASDEFMERSSILNWTPGVEPVPSKRGKKRG